MKKFTTTLLLTAMLFTLTVFPARANSAQSQIISLMEEYPVPIIADPSALAVSENTPPVDVKDIRDLYSVSKKIVLLSAELSHIEISKIEGKVNAYIDSVEEASSYITDKNSETYAEILEQKSSLEYEINAQPPRISSVDNIYPDEEFTVSVHCMYKSQKQREYTLIFRNITTGKIVNSEKGVIQPGGTNSNTVFTAHDCSEGDKISITVKYNGAEHGNVPDCIFDGVVLGNTKQITTPAPTEQPTERPTEQPVSFVAEIASDWAKPEIERARDMGIVPRTLRENYTENITRAEFCTLAESLIEYRTQMDIDDFAAQHSSVQPVFDDTSADTIKACARLGIVTGYDDNTFRPDDDITREQAAAMLARCARILGMTDKPGMFAFNDRDDVSPWAVNNVRFVKANGIMDGDENGNFLPHQTYTVEQAIVTFYRLSGKLDEI